MATRIKGKNKNKPYTTRYFHEGRQREKSFRTAREEADFRAKFEHDSREQIFVDPKVAKQRFEDAAAEWLARHPGSAKTKQVYETALRLHVLPVLGTRTLADVARDRDGVEKLVRETLPAKGLGPSVIRTCYVVTSAIVLDAIKSGKLNQTRLRGIKLPQLPVKTEIVFVTPYQICEMSNRIPVPYGFTLYLMYGCGLRLGEALGVRRDDFIEGGKTLRLQRQMMPDGSYGPLKHRSADDYRDIPVPAYVSEAMISYWAYFPPLSHRKYHDWLKSNRNFAYGLPETVTPHMLRHNYASNCLAAGIPITDVSKWLGHRSIQVTYGIYGHLVPASWDRARAVLDEEWKS